MSYKAAKSKRNLKKSIYFGGSMAFGAAVVGLGVSIPVYLDIQAQLKENISKLADLSGFMSDLIDKLGIPPSEEFRKELEGGYTVVFKDGKTQIFSSIDGRKSLVLNMNGDGSVGTAGSMTGLAAQKMLHVVTEATSTLGAEAAALDDILGPFKDVAEEESLATESAITGRSIDELRAEHILSVDQKDPAKVAAALQKLKDENLLAAKVAAEAAIADRKRLAKEMEAAVAQGAAAKKKLIEERAILAEQRIKDADAALRASYAKYIFVTAGITTTTQLILASLPMEELIIKYNAAKQMVFDKAISKANEEKTKAIVAKASQGGGNASVIDKITANPASTISVLASTFGYKFGTVDKQKSKTVRGMIWHSLNSRRKITIANFNKLVVGIARILGIPAGEVTTWESINTTIPKVKMSVISLINTYDEKQADIARAEVFSISLTGSSNKTGYIAARSSSKSIFDLETTKIFLKGDSTSADNNIGLLDALTNIASIKDSVLVRNIALKEVIKIIDSTSNAVAPTSTQYVEKMKSLANAIGTHKGSKYQKAWKSLITVEFIKKLLLEGKTIDFEVSAISNISEVLAKHDEMKNASLSSRDLNDIYQTIDHFRGTWLTDYLKNIHTFNRTKLEKESKAIALFSSEYLKDPHEAVYDQVFKLADSQLSYQIITEEGNPTLKLLSSKDPDIKEFMSKPFMTLEKTAAFMKSIYQRGQAVDIAKLENHIKQVMFLKGRTGFNAMMLNAPDYVLHKLKMLQPDITPLFPNNLDVTSWLNALNSEQARIDAIVSSSSKALPSDALVAHSATYTAAIGLKYGVNIVMNAAYDYTYTTTLTGISIVPHLSGDPLTEPSSSGPEIAMHLTRADNLKLKTEQTKLNGITSSGSQATPSDILIHDATPIDSAAVLKYGLLEKCTTYASATAAIAAATGISTSAFRWQTTQKPFDIYIDGVKKHFLKGARVMFNWSTGDKQFAIRTKASIDDNDAIWITSRSAGTGVLIKTIAFSKIPFGSQDFQYTYTTSAAGITVTAHLKSNPNAASLITPREIILHSTRTEILALNNEQTRINSLTSVNSWVSSADALVGAWTPLTTSIASKYGVTIVFDSKYDYKYKSTATGIKIMVHMKNHPQRFSSIVPALITLDHSRADVAEMVATQNKINALHPTPQSWGTPSTTPNNFGGTAAAALGFHLSNPPYVNPKFTFKYTTSATGLTITTYWADGSSSPAVHPTEIKIDQWRLPAAQASIEGIVRAKITRVTGGMTYTMMGGLSAVTDAIPGSSFWDTLGHSPALTAAQLNGAVLTVTHGAITRGMGAQTLTMVFKIRGTAKTFRISIQVQF